MRDDAQASPHQNLRHLLADPLIHLVMRADKVSAAEIEELYRRISGRPDSSQMSPGTIPVSGCVAIQPRADASYRSGVGIMLLNAENEIFIGQRLSPPNSGWQMPQGGIEPGEHPRDAALRELREEIGTDRVAFLVESKGWLRYDLPVELNGKVWGGRWRGQQQKWFGMRFLGSDMDIRITTEHPEFAAWRWAPASEIADLIVVFKRQLYLDVLEEFQTVYTK